MNAITVLYPERIHLIWLALIALAILFWLDLRGREKLRAFVSTTMQARLVKQMSTWRRLLSLGFVGLMLVLTTVTLMRPRTTRAETRVTQQVSADLMVVLDVSKSMLATDAAPNRLERAKAELRDMLPELKGTRVGLVAFAGSSAVVCPLTTDHGFFQLVLDSTDPSSVSRGGTRIGDALSKALRSLGDESRGARAILLITDGEDHDSYPVEAAKAAREAGVPIIAIGFGDEAGSEILVEDPETGARQPLKDRDGNQVRSKLDGETLRQIVEETQGAYVPAGTAVLDLESIIKDHINPLLSAGETTLVKESHTELYPWFAAGALMALFAFALLRSRLFESA